MKAAFYTLGCKVNQYETEAIKEQFVKRGYEIVGDKEPADIYLINTCSVTSLADRKSRQYIRRVKKINPEGIVVVTGCYVQVNKDEVAAIEGVNIIAGTNEKKDIIDHIEEYIEQSYDDTVEYVGENDKMTEFVEWGAVTSMESRTRAYVKIQEGCNRYCSYCIIPYARGDVRSRDPEEVLNECKTLIRNGFKEIILTGINTALCENLYTLLEKLDDLPGEFRVRLSSLEPTVVNAEYVKKLFGFKRLCHHLHLSLQSGSDKVLKDMNRRYDRREYLEIIKTLQKFDPTYGITTDVIVGFPGEENEDFEKTLDMIEEAEFCRIHAFKYSKRSGTPAAEMKNQISPLIKKERSDILIKKGELCSKKFCKKNIGEYQTVLFEEYNHDKNALTGYTGNYIYTYLEGSEEELKKYKNSLVNVYIREIFEDGVKVDII